MSEENKDNQNKEVKVSSRKRTEDYTYGSYSNYDNSYGYNNYGSYSNYGGYNNNYGGYNNGYNGYYGGGQYQQGGDVIPNRTFKDYLGILKERMAWIIVTFFVIFLSVALYTWRATPMYESVARIQIIKDPNTNKAVTGETNASDIIGNDTDLATQLKILESQEVVFNVLARMTEEEKKALMAPYEDTFSLMPKLTEAEIVAKNRGIGVEGGSFVVAIAYKHPDPLIAKNMADLFAQEYINFTKDVKVQRLMEEQSALKLKLEQQAEKVKLLDQKLVDYREKNGANSLDLREDVDTTELMNLNQVVLSNKTALDRSMTNWVQLQEYRDNNKPLEDLYFIATFSEVSSLVANRTNQQIALSALSKRYKDKHPQMIEAKNRLEQTEKELEFALESVYQKIKASHDALQRNYDVSLADLEAKKAEIINLKRLAVEYNAILREQREEEGIHSALISAYTRKTNEIYLIRPNAQTLDRAFLPTRPSSPNYLMNIVVGFAFSLFVGVGVALFVAFIDDRVKSAFDIEVSIGLPLLGVLPRVRRLGASEKARITSTNKNKFVTEAFRSLYSSIGVSPLAKDAKLYLSTSTTPSEGKSFIMTNLACTSGANGDRVLLIDADLRLPSVAKNLDLKPEKGIVSVVKEAMPLDEAIMKDVFPNVDLLPCERKVSNPMQILNSQAFMDMIEELKGKYDKIFIDTPPVGVVSDVMSIYPLVDAVIYVVKYNSVKRSLIKGSVKRMVEANVPLMGVVMNMVKAKTNSDYGNLYNKKYQNYYSKTPDEVKGKAPKDNTPKGGELK